jgi:hypothetical protein
VGVILSGGNVDPAAATGWLAVSAPARAGRSPRG